MLWFLLYQVYKYGYQQFIILSTKLWSMLISDLRSQMLGLLLMLNSKNWLNSEGIICYSNKLLLFFWQSYLILVTTSLSFSYPLSNKGFLTLVDVEDGHTLHLVVRQPGLPPPGSLYNHSGLLWLSTCIFVFIINVICVFLLSRTCNVGSLSLL
jgi:hypothetical protein